MPDKKKRYDAEAELYRWYSDVAKGNFSSPAAAIGWQRTWQSFFQHIVETEGSLNNKICLEAGCGENGLFKFFLAQGAELVETDLVFDALVSLKNKGAENVVGSDVFTLPFKEGTFDIVFGIGLLHHLASLEQPLAEMVRVLKSGGAIYVLEPNMHYFLTAFIDYLPSGLVRKMRQSWFPQLLKGYVQATPYERPLKNEEVKGALRLAATQQVKQRFISLSPPYLPKMVSWAHDTLARLIIRLFPSTSRYLNFEFIVFGRKL